MRAVIMAGGKGTRLRPLTNDIPKPMVKIIDKPVMEHIINLLRKHEITEIAVTLGHMSQCIIDYFGDGSKWDVKLTYFVEDTPLGTAGVKEPKICFRRFSCNFGRRFHRHKSYRRHKISFCQRQHIYLIAQPHQGRRAGCWKRISTIK